MRAARRPLAEALRRAERSVRAARRPLAEALRRAERSVEFHLAKLAPMLRDQAVGWPIVLNETVTKGERAVADATATFKARLVALMTFDLMNNVVGADYPQLPSIDREAIAAQSKADHQRSLDEIRARFRPKDNFLRVVLGLRPCDPHSADQYQPDSHVRAVERGDYREALRLLQLYGINQHAN